MSERYRNHPIVILRSVLASIILLAVIAFNVYSNIDDISKLEFDARFLLVLLIPLLFLIYGIVCWSKTYITIEEDHALAERWVLYRITKVIPYGKVASVNEVKGVVGRIIGCTTLQININSAHNAARPELIFTFSDELAKYVSKVLKNGIGNNNKIAAAECLEEEASAEDVDKPDEADCIYRFNAMDAVMFGIFGSNTWSLLFTVFFGIYSLVSMFLEASAGVVSIVLMIFSGVIPMTRNIIRHGDFRIYRTGDKIRLMHGMMALYDTSFNISRVNAVTVKRSFFARLIRKCSIEAEVVGINALEGDVTPTVTLLIPEKELESAMKRIFPEIDVDYELCKQPAKALRPNFTRSILFSLPITLFFAMILFCAWKYDDEFDNIDLAILLAFMIIPPAVLIPRGLLVQRMYRIGYGERLFTIRYGVLDTKECTMQYSRVQISQTVATPFVRKKGLARASFSILSSAGARDVSIGFYPESDLRKVGEKAVEQSGMKLLPRK